MFKILLVLLLMTSSAWATQWRAGTGEQSLLGSSNSADIDYNTYNSIVKPLDSLLATYCNQYLSYTSSSSLTVSAGSVTVSNSGGTIRLMLQNTSPTVITSANLDTGALASGTTYYVYATAATNAATAATYFISASNTSPSGQTYYYQIGSFTTDANTQIAGVFNNYYSTFYVGTSTSKTVGVIYQALTDGIVTTTGQVGNSFSMNILTGSISASMTTVATWAPTTTAGLWTNTLIWPVRKGDYYEVTDTTTPAPTVNFIPTSK